jgi:hypothetical protein
MLEHRRIDAKLGGEVADRVRIDRCAVNVAILN